MSFMNYIKRLGKRNTVLAVTAGTRDLVVDNMPKSHMAEGFRTLRTNIQFMNPNKELKTILVTSTEQGEGKSYTVSNLAVTFAQAGKKVVIVDSDMRNGRQHNIFSIQKAPGLSNYLSGLNVNNEHESVINYISSTGIENLSILPMGNTPPNPSELIASERMMFLIDVLKSAFDIIIFDGTPSSLVSDSIILSRIVDTTLIVSKYNTTKMDKLKKVKKDIENVGGKMAGVVINQFPMNVKKYDSPYFFEQPKKLKRYELLRVGRKVIGFLKREKK